MLIERDVILSGVELVVLCPLIRVDKDWNLGPCLNTQFKLSCHHGSNSAITHFRLSCNLAINCPQLLAKQHTSEQALSLSPSLASSLKRTKGELFSAFHILCPPFLDPSSIVTHFHFALWHTLHNQPGLNKVLEKKIIDKIEERKLTWTSGRSEPACGNASMHSTPWTTLLLVLSMTTCPPPSSSVSPPPPSAPPPAVFPLLPSMPLLPSKLPPDILFPPALPTLIPILLPTVFLPPFGLLVQPIGYPCIQQW